MKTVSVMFLGLFIVVPVLAQQKQQSFESRYWEVILKDREVMASDSLVQEFINAPECFTPKDTSGIPVVAGVSKYIDSNDNGWLLIVVAITPPEKIGVTKDKLPLIEPRSPVLLHVIQQILIFRKIEGK